MARTGSPEAPEQTRPGRSFPKIDPRFARRWAQVRREQGRRRLRIVLIAGAVAVLVALAGGSLYSPLLAVRHVRISTVGAVDRGEVLSVSGLARRRPLIEVDSRAVAARLDAVVDLGGAQVRRSWPTTVLIRVIRRTPIAQVQVTSASAAKWATVDVTGRILADVASRIVGLPVLQGAGPIPPPGGWLVGSAGPTAALGAASAGQSLVDLDAAEASPAMPVGPAAALAIVAALPPSVRADVLSVGVGQGAQLTMSVLPATIAAGSIPVDLGDGSQLAQKLTALAAMLAQANLSGVTEIDLSVPDRPAALTTRQTTGTLSTLAGG
jgi:hypothetical protein